MKFFSKTIGVGIVAGAMICSACPVVSATVESEIVKNISLPDTPKDITLSPDGTTVYILGERTITVYSLTENSIVETIPLEKSFSRIVFHGETDRLFLIDEKSKEMTVMHIEHIYDIPAGDSPVIGSPDTPVTVVAFLDIQCPYCGRVYPVLQQLINKYPGKARLIIKQFPLRMHRYAEPAARAALAASRQGKYKEMLDRLFQNYKTLNEKSIDSYAQELGLDMEQYQKDLKDPAVQAQIRNDMQLGRTLKVRGVPALFINGRQAANRSLASLSAMVDTELEKKSSESK